MENLKDKYIFNPPTVHSLALELKKVVDNYWRGSETETNTKNYINYVARNSFLLIENGKDINPTLKQRLGKKRIALIVKLLDGYQLKA